MRMGATTAAIAVALLAVAPADVERARADYAASVPLGQEPRYLSLAVEDANLVATTQFLVCATSKSAVLDGTVPLRMPGTMLLRIDLRALGWDVRDWMAVAGWPNNPTTKYENPLVIEANWFANQLADGTRSGAYFRLLFGKKPPKTLNELLDAFGIDRKDQNGLAYGVIPNASDVNLAKNAARLLEHSDGVNSEAWITWDVAAVKPGSDPLQGLFVDQFQADGSEGYILTTRVATTLDGTAERVVMPVVFLADGKGNLVFEAPANLVADNTELFGDRIIRSPGSCFVCHTEGSQPVGENALSERLKQGVELKAYDYARQREIEFFHLADIAPELARWDEGFGRATWHINGLTPSQNAAAIKQAIGNYRRDVTLETAAAELGVTPDNLRNALALASASYVDVGPRLAGLAHGTPTPRTQWEQDWLKALKYLEGVK